MNTWGKNIRLSIFGESHGRAIGLVLDGLPPGLELDWALINGEMARRAPGKDGLSTPRRESDSPEIISGLLDNKTTGAPLCALIYNSDARSKDYSSTALRPGHADMPAFVKYKGFSDFRGGGHFSGRLTAPLVFAGAIAKQLLAQRGITVEGKAAQICGFTGEEEMKRAVLLAKSEGDSVGGIIECVARGVPIGLGEPFFASFESVAASMLFSIPAVKGVEFGDGFSMAGLRGSQANDPIRYGGKGFTLGSNHSGGINGGITNSAPIVVRAAIRPTPTISKEQQTVDRQTLENTEAAFSGRHDPCVVFRAVPVVEAGLALCILDLMIEAEK